MNKNELTDAFGAYLTELIAERRYRRIQYFTDLHELITVDALIKPTPPGATGDWLTLSSGETVPMNQVVSVGGRFAPDYNDYQPYCDTCDH